MLPSQQQAATCLTVGGADTFLRTALDGHAAGQPDSRVIPAQFEHVKASVRAVCVKAQTVGRTSSADMATNSGHSGTQRPVAHAALALQLVSCDVNHCV